MTRNDTTPAPNGAKHPQMSPEEWANVIARAERDGNDRHAELMRVASRFDDGTSVGHGLSGAILILSMAGRVARSAYEVNEMTSRLLGDMARDDMTDRFEQLGKLHAEGTEQ